MHAPVISPTRYPAHPPSTAHPSLAHIHTHVHTYGTHTRTHTPSHTRTHTKYTPSTRKTLTTIPHTHTPHALSHTFYLHHLSTWFREWIAEKNVLESIFTVFVIFPDVHCSFLNGCSFRAVAAFLLFNPPNRMTWITHRFSWRNCKFSNIPPPSYP